MNLSKYVTKVPILCFHDISTRKSEISITPRLFHRVLAYLHRRRSPLSLSEFIQAVRSENWAKLRKKYVVTFDDGVKSIKTEALPIMKELKIPGNIFLPTKYLGGNMNDYPGEHEDLPLLDEMEIQKILNEGWEIHAHSHAHRSMKSMDRESFRTDAERNLEIINNLRDQRVSQTGFAFPYNEKNQELNPVLQDTFDAAFTVDLAPYRPNQDLYAISRIEHYNSEPLVAMKCRSRRVRIGNVNFPI